jgi:acyl-CoA synthetase (AMP-forming)/AMP-acid ligase II
MRPGGEAYPEQLLQHCAADLAKYNVPALLAVVEALPKTPSAKSTGRRSRRYQGDPGRCRLWAVNLQGGATNGRHGVI